MLYVPTIELVIQRKVFFYDEFSNIYFYLFGLTHTLSRHACHKPTMAYLLQLQLCPIIVLALVSNYTDKLE